MSISVCIDWGSTSFRAYRIDRDGICVDSIESGDGIKSLKTNNSDQMPANAFFEHTLFRLVGDWLTPGDTVLLSGMITSRSGWYESDYLPCPASLDTLISRAFTQSIRDITCHFLPGISQTAPRADVMRGEELQLLGIAQPNLDSWVILPGTHSKWAYLSGMTVRHFHTLMTGELYDLLLNQSLAGALAEPDHSPDHGDNHWDEAAFADGVARGYSEATLVRDLFTCRAAVLLGKLNPKSVPALLSGLVIGNEIREGMLLMSACPGQSLPVINLVGNPTLCQRYTVALKQCGISVASDAVDTAVAGFQTLIRHQR